jgi:hypothetical protein
MSTKRLTPLLLLALFACAGGEKEDKDGRTDDTATPTEGSDGVEGVDGSDGTDGADGADGLPIPSIEIVAAMPALDWNQRWFGKRCRWGRGMRHGSSQNSRLYPFKAATR